MPDQLQLRGGTTTEHNSFTGALREVTVDTTKKTLVVHDGASAGGTPLMRENGSNAASTVGIGVGGANKITINADGHVDIASNLDCAAGLDVTGNITATGNVGIGTTSPSEKLEVSGDIQVTSGGIKVTGATPGIRFTDTAATGGFGHVGVNNTSGSLVLRSDDGNALSGTFMGFEVDGSERLRIDSSGRVMMGTTTVGHGNADNLTVSDAGNCGITIRAGNTADSSIYFADTDSDNVSYMQYDHNLNDFRHIVNGLQAFRIDATAQIDLGLTSFAGSSAVRCFGNAGGIKKAALTVLNGKASVAGRGAGVSVGGNTAAIGSFYAQKAGNNDSSGGTTFIESTGALKFATAGDLSTLIPPTDAQTKMVIDTSGNVGIGTTSPATLLTLKRDSAGTSEGAYPLLALDNGNPNGFLQVRFQDDGTEVASILSHTNDKYLAFRAGGSTESMRIDASGNVAIGTSSAAQKLHIDGGSNDPFLMLQRSGAGDAAVDIGGVQMKNSTNTLADIRCRSIDINDGELKFSVMNAGSLTERAKITSNGIETGSTIIQSGANNLLNPVVIDDAINNNFNTDCISFRKAGSEVGSILCNRSVVTYGTSSDYRLKENAVEISDGITRLKTLIPRRFNFISDKDKTVDGFFAHEVTAVPEAITGTKDQVATEDIDGKNIKKGDPIYQQIDQSKLVPLLVAAVQELIGKVEALEAA